MDLYDKCIIVTGGAQGLGRAIVENLLQEGAKVVVYDNDDIAMQGLAAHSNLDCISCDLTDEESINLALNNTFKIHPKIHGLVNNAGILHSEPLLNLMTKDRRHNLHNWHKVLKINLTAPFLLTSYISEHMAINRIKGVIINISSISAGGNAGQTAYSAAKAGLEAMTKVWAKELGPLGIRSVAIAPGFMETNSTQHAISANFLNETKKRTPLRRLGEAQEIAEAVRFAFTNNFFNGSILEVNGGLKI